jgi:RNA polymerase sporulation-specific sigma factor
LLSEEKIEELVLKAKNGCEDSYNALFAAFDQDIKRGTAKFYILGSEKDDVLQEARLGFVRAVKSYKPESSKHGFAHFVRLVFKRNVMTAVSAARRKKREISILTESLDYPVPKGSDQGDQPFKEFIKDPNWDILQDVIHKEEYVYYVNKLKNMLTPMELKVFSAFAASETYKTIAADLGMNHKAVDNALMRIRTKAQRLYAMSNDGFSENAKCK